MESEYQHKILVVDDDKKTDQIFENVFQAKNFEFVFVNSGESAFKEIKKTEKHFSVIIAYQGLEKITGSQILKQARESIPNTIRILIISHAQVDTIIHAVNKGAIQNIIVKPWTDESLGQAVMSSIKLYDFYLEDKKLLKLAKQQSKNLYELDCKLMKSKKNSTKIMQDLDTEIETIKKNIQAFALNTSDKQNLTPDKIVDEMQNHVKNDQGVDPEKLKTLFKNTIKNLYDQFNEISYRNGFEMPDIKGEVK